MFQPGRVAELVIDLADVDFFSVTGRVWSLLAQMMAGQPCQYYD